VDDFFIALKQSSTDGLRNEASNAMNSAPGGESAGQRPPLPRREATHLAVHRFDNILYYKRLEPEAFAILTALDHGVNLEKACTDAIEGSSRQNADWPVLIRDWFQNWSELKWLCRR